MKKILLLLWVSLVYCFPVTVFALDSNKSDCNGLADSMPCNLKIISWVEVSIQGDLLKKHKAEFEKLIRLRLRNDLSMYKHEVRKFSELIKENGYDMKRKELKERGDLSCHVWTVGKDYPVAFLVECKLSGWGSYSSPLYEEIESKILGYASAQSLRKQVEESMRGTITDVSADLLEAKDRLKTLGK